MGRANEVVVRLAGRGLRTEISARGQTVIADEPVEAGGSGEGLTPYDYLAASLGACTAMTIRWYANRREWPLDSVTVRVTHSRVHEEDCERCESETVGIDQLARAIELSGDLTEEQREGLLRIADRCPVGQTLIRGVRIVATESEQATA